jgi:hypothetical protein
MRAAKQERTPTEIRVGALDTKPVLRIFLKGGGTLDSIVRLMK